MAIVTPSTYALHPAMTIGRSVRMLSEIGVLIAAATAAGATRCRGLIYPGCRCATRAFHRPYHQNWRAKARNDGRGR